MRRWHRSLRAIALLLGLLALCVGGLARYAGTDAGRRGIERWVARLTQGRISIQGLSGDLPRDVRIDRLEIRDADGVWLSADGIVVHAQLAGLLGFPLHVTYASAKAVDIARLPHAQVRGAGSADPLAYARRVEVDGLSLPRIVLGPALAGQPAILRAEGMLHAARGSSIRAALTVERLDQPGTYRAMVTADDARIDGVLDVAEPVHGPLATLLDAPDIGAIAAHVQLRGPRAATALVAELQAGALAARAAGTVDWTHETGNLDLRAESGALKLRPDRGWDAIALNGRWRGSLHAPDVWLRGDLTRLRSGRGELGSLHLEASLASGGVSTRATVAGLRLAGLPTGLFDAGPLELQVDGQLQGPAPALSFRVAHTLGSFAGHVQLAARRRLEFALDLPSVAPFAAAAGVGITGRGAFTGAISGTIDDLDATFGGVLSDASGASPWSTILGRSTRVDVAIRRRGDTLDVERAELASALGRIALSGDVRGRNLELEWGAELPMLAALDPAVAGSLTSSGTLRGPIDDFAATLDARARMSVRGSAPGVLSLSASASGLPRRPAAELQASGRLDEAPLRFAASLAASERGLRVAIRQASWKSATADGEFAIPEAAGDAHGTLVFSMLHLDDLAYLVGEPLSGRVRGQASFGTADGQPNVQVDVSGHDVRFRDVSVSSAVLSGRIADPLSSPVLGLRMEVDDIGPASVGGKLTLAIRGPPDALAARLTASWDTGVIGVAALDATGLADVGLRRLSLTALDVRTQDTGAHLLRPATIDARDGLAITDLRIGAATAVVALSGRLLPVLDAHASVAGLSPGALAPYLSEHGAEGAIGAEAVLSGTLAAPRGTIELRGTGLRAGGDAARTLPAMDVVGAIVLDGKTASVDLGVKAGTLADLRATGAVPLRAGASLDVRARGQLALSLLNPLVEPRGRRLRGDAAFDLVIAGSRNEPRLQGSASIVHGEFQDYVNGTRLTDASLLAEASGRSLRVTRLFAHAGRGTVSGEGTIGLLQPGIPVSLRITASDAQAVANDLLTATVNASAAITGTVSGVLTVAGHVKTLRADINIPNALPHEVAVLDVRRAAGRRVRPKPAPLPALALDLSIEAERAVFVRGRGLDAELGGELLVSGTTQSPRYAGGFAMRRGTLALAGASLKFTRGAVSFNGTSGHAALDPTLDFTAESSSNDVTATLSLGGFASSPTIALTSTPDLPQDEILARLLFGVGAKQIAPLQMLSIGVALASISGVGAGTLDPIATVQRRLGLDRLSIGGGSGADANAAVVEAGRYVTNRVYVGATQSTSGVTKFQAQIDLSRHLKLQTVVGNGSATAQGTTPQNDPGNTLTLLYQIEY